MNDEQSNTDGTVDLGSIPQSDKPYLPGRGYYAVCIEALFTEVGAKKTPTISLKWEIVEPAIVSYQGSDIMPVGVIVNDNIWLTEKSMGRVAQFHRSMKLPTKGFNPKAPDTKVYLGKGAYIALATKGKPMLVEGTDDPVLNQAGKPIVTFQYEVKSIPERVERLDREVNPY